MAGYRSDETSNLRVLFCLGVTQTMCDEEVERLPTILETLTEAFSDLEGRFGLKILGSFDDDQIMVGPSTAWPWTGYILADVPSYDVIVQVCNIVREVNVGPHRLWRYLRIEARIGRELFFLVEK